MRLSTLKTLLIAACAVTAVAGCAATHTTTGTVTAASGTPAPPTARERAVAEAAAILRAFAVPPGGQRLPKAPDALKFPSSTLVSTALVDDVSFWRAPGRPQAVLAWAGGPPLAVAQGPGACGIVQFSVGGQPQPALQITDSFIPQVLRRAGLSWKVP